jgi:RNA polymerase primary sigma factor
MNDKIVFREMLTEIVELAETKSNKLTIDEIDDFFKKVSLKEEQMELVYSYLEANKIVVEGHKQNDNIKMFEVIEEDAQEIVKNEDNEDKQEIAKQIDTFDAEENQYLKMYLDELGTLTVINEKEKIALYNKAIKGEPLAKSRIIEIYLQEVVEIAKKYVNKGILISDLIQEGNIGLMLAIDGIEELSAADQVEKMLRMGIISSIESVIKENDDIKIAKKQIVNRVNYLNEGVTNLEEELGRRVSIPELAKYMEMSEEEVIDIIRVSDNEIIVKENEDKNSNR